MIAAKRQGRAGVGDGARRAVDAVGRRAGAAHPRARGDLARGRRGAHRAHRGGQPDDQRGGGRALRGGARRGRRGRCARGGGGDAERGGAAAVPRRALHHQGVLRAHRHAAVVGAGGAQGTSSPRHDATAVARLRAAGAIPLGVTNTSELCMWYETQQPRLRAHQQPLRRRRASSAAARAARARSSAPAARPSGSAATSAARSACRRSSTASSATSRPAASCPARGSIRWRRRGARASSPPARWPARRGSVAAPALMAGPDGHDEGATAMTLGDPSAVRLDELTVVDVEDNGLNPVAPRAQGGAGARRRRARRARRAAAPRALRRAAPLVRDLVGDADAAGDGQSFSVLLGNGRRTRGAVELAKWAVRRSPHTLPAIGLAMLERINDWAPARAAASSRWAAACARELLDALGDGVMLYPSYVSPAPRHYKPLWPPFNFVYTAIINVMQLPATQVPLGLGSEGLPLGVQIVGRPAARSRQHRRRACSSSASSAAGSRRRPSTEVSQAPPARQQRKRGSSPPPIGVDAGSGSRFRPVQPQPPHNLVDHLAHALHAAHAHLPPRHIHHHQIRRPLQRRQLRLQQRRRHEVPLPRHHARVAAPPPARRPARSARRRGCRAAPPGTAPSARSTPRRPRRRARRSPRPQPAATARDRRRRAALRATSSRGSRAGAARPLRRTASAAAPRARAPPCSCRRRTRP